MKKIILTLTILGMILMVSSCSKTNNTKSIFASKEASLSYQMVSSIQMFETMALQQSTTAQSDRLNLSNEVIEKEDVEKYLQMMEELLTTNGGFNSTILESDKPEYAKRIEITTQNLQGVQTTYNMYYNETASKTEIDDDDDDDEVSTTTWIEGIALVDNNTYRLEGKIETETERDENETESYFKVIIDDQNYVIVTDEVETETNEYEQEFTYEVVANGQKVAQLSFELEKEKDELFISVKDITSNSKKIYTFDLEEKLGTKYIHIKIVDGSKIVYLNVRVVYDVASGEYKYNYEYAQKSN